MGCRALSPLVEPDSGTGTDTDTDTDTGTDADTDSDTDTDTDSDSDTDADTDTDTDSDTDVNPQITGIEGTGPEIPISPRPEDTSAWNDYEDERVEASKRISSTD